ncbi:SDR family NAD(P)-dependent oxidoreductase [Spiribacter sp. C176]|uniref:SDR family NAD(P)-dependent oxidoreductase n=1 Tax=Spiribacter salilacus TaxID=2664894 RepID=A0A6N7QMN7_9GAMM|nr:SDR family NAD(P)-dependent oxidoreductase [Spiribacter salilacus]MRH77302.1 SDR family NAD(P)-dependent oxidoreductase [Spiribacter salilacus]
MQQTTVITGGGSGIGQALAKRLAEHGQHVLIIGRRAEALEETQGDQANIEPCVADVSTAEGRANIVKALRGKQIQWLVHNAGILEPVGPLLAQSTDALRKAWAVNVEGPISLSAALIEQMPAGSRILHVSSGAAHTAYPGWGAYCMTKAALHMAYEILRQELDERDVAVGSLRPGVVDTPMQALIRSQTEADFPAVEQFQALKSSGSLATPEQVAAYMHNVLEKTDAGLFSAQEWDIRNGPQAYLT